MKTQTLISYLALHRRGYFLAALWTALCSTLFVTFVWQFRFASFGMTEGDPAMDAFLQIPVSDAIRVTRYSALLCLAPSAALLVAMILIFADTLLYAFQLDRNKVWFEAVKWSLRGRKALLAWFSAVVAAFLLVVNIDQPVLVWIFAMLGILLFCLLPFVAWNESNIALKNPTLSNKPQWPGAKPILLAATFIAIATVLDVYYAFAEEYLLHPALSLLIGLAMNFIYAISLLAITFYWVNRSKKFSFREVVNLKNVGGFFSLNMMFGLWSLVVLAPVVIYAGLISIYLMPSITNVYKEQSVDIPVLLKYFDEASNFIIAYGSLLLLSIFYWVLVYAYGRLVFQFGSAPQGIDKIGD